VTGWRWDATSAPLATLLEKIDGRATGIRLYGIAPPKRATPPELLADIAAQQVRRLRELAPDGLVIYDIQDEPGPAGQERPFPFLPTVDPAVYGHEALSDLALPKVVYRSVGAGSRDELAAWLDSLKSKPALDISVFVGAPRGQAKKSGLTLDDAYALARPVTNLHLGGVAIAERHAVKGDEHLRLLRKQAAGCRFFVTQSVYDASSSKSLLSDYSLTLQAESQQPVPLILTFSPCGTVRTLEFMKWLGISFPRWLENELRHSSDTLERSIDLCEDVFAEVQDYAREKRLPIGINVESVSIRKSEVDASVELYRRLSSRLDG
jgi:hypothetical protein